MKVKATKVILIGVILMVASVLTHVADNWTIGAQNEATMAQVNGGDTELAVMLTTNSALGNIRTAIIPIGIVMCLCIVIGEAIRIKKEGEKDTCSCDCK